MGQASEQRVRPAEQADLDGLRQLFTAANEEHRRHVPAVIFRNYLDNLLDLVAEAPPPGMLVVAAGPGRVLATGTVVGDSPSTWSAGVATWSAGVAVLRAMAVDPAVRGRSLGRLVAEACLARARVDGATGMMLHTAPFMVAAVRLYEALGFRRLPERDVAIDDLFGPSGEPYEELAIAFRLDFTPPRGEA